MCISTRCQPLSMSCKNSQETNKIQSLNYFLIPIRLTIWVVLVYQDPDRKSHSCRSDFVEVNDIWENVLPLKLKHSHPQKSSNKSYYLFFDNCLLENCIISSEFNYAWYLLPALSYILFWLSE